MAFTPPTLLQISGIDLGNYSARGLTMTLAPIVSGQGLRRSINGTLLNLTAPQFQKYSGSISCTDQEAPALEGVWQGMPVTITCIPNMGETVSAGVLVISAMIDSWNISVDEYGHEGTWTINFLEV